MAVIKRTELPVHTGYRGTRYHCHDCGAELKRRGPDQSQKRATRRHYNTTSPRELWLDNVIKRSDLSSFLRGKFSYKIVDWPELS